MKPKLLFYLVLFLSGAAARASEEYAVKVRPISLQIVSPNFETNRPKPFNYEAKMALGLLVEAEATPLVAIESQSSFMEQVGDDVGAAWKPPLGTFEWFPTISSNGHAAVVTFNSANTPAKGAKTINATGKLKIIFGKAKESFEFKDVPLTAQSLAVHQQKFSITRVSEQRGVLGDDLRAGPVPVINVCFRLEGESSPWLESISFFDPAGNPIKARKSASRVSSSSAEWEYNLPKEIKAATIKITLWTEHEARLVPFSFTAGVGL